jgi:hypothetical protein
MTKEEIICMALEAGFNKFDYGLRDDGSWATYFDCWPEQIERFAALVAEAEREACAKFCDARYMGDNNREDMEAKRCAAAIRARGDK